MTMGVLIPIGNIAIYLPDPIPASYPLWDSGTSYFGPLKTRVTYGPSMMDYEAIASSTNVVPPTDATKWAEVGMTGTLKAFDGKIGEKHPGGLYAKVAELNPTLGINACAVFGLEGTALRLKVTDPVDGTVYDQTQSLVDNSQVVDFYEYFFSPIVLMTEAIFLDLPPYLGAKYEITATKDLGATPALGGEIILGYNYTLGDAVEGTGIGIEDYSTKDRDTFGNAILVPRAFAQTVNFSVSVKTNRLRSTQAILGTVLAKPAVYHTGATSNLTGTLVYGVLKDFSAPIPGSEVTFATIEVEGLI